MKPARFDYFRPASLAEALDALSASGDEARILAGGQSLMPMLNLRLASPSLLVDINRVPGLDRIAEEERSIRVGALARHADLLRAVGGITCHPLLAAALPFVAHQAVRNRGTVCGSLALADPASELPACAVCLDAEIALASAGGRRVVPASEFFLGLYETAVRPDEMITDVMFPRPGADWHYTFEEISRRHGDFALAGLAASFRISRGTVEECRLVFFGVADRPVRSRRAEQAVAGKPARELPAGELVGGLAAAEIEVIGSDEYSAAYKAYLVAVLVRRALATIPARLQ